MQERLTNIVEGMLIITTTASFILACYVMMALSNMPQ
jgi:hypothetical protein